MLIRRCALPISLLLFSILVGCKGASSKGDGEGTGGTPTGKEALASLAELLNHFEHDQKKMPSRLSEVEPVEPLFPGAYVGLANGTIVYQWGARIDKSAGSTVLAYEKKAEADRGWVLLQDGSLKEMSADELRGAPKASK